MSNESNMSRRDFLQKSAMTAAAVSMPMGVFSQSNSQIKVGVVGLGGRGAGAATDACAANPNVVIWSAGDMFEDRLNGSLKYLNDNLKTRCQVTKERIFTGFDAYKKVIASGVDVVILTSPPGFRPVHFAAAVEAGKHVFMEKPVAVDGPGVRSVIASAELAKAKKLNVIAGTQRRSDPVYLETMKRIRDGQIGDVVACYAYWNQGGLWMYPRKEEWTDMEWQIRNWLYFTWLSGDHICEQHIHNIDVCNWAMNDHPAKAVSLAGRQVRTDAAYGHIFDHFATEYEYANGVKMLSMCRQIDGTASRVSEHVVGSKGTSNCNGRINGVNSWRYEGPRPNPYVEEHKRLYAAILGGGYENEGVQVAHSTLTAIMGRMAAYTGGEVTWEQAMNSQESLVPADLKLGPIEVPAVAVPGKTKLI